MASVEKRVVQAPARAGRGHAAVWRWLAMAIVGVGLGLRLWGIGFGLPELFHPDEPAYVLQALAVARGLPESLTFANPPLFKYLLLGEYAATYAVDRLAGNSHSAAEFVEQFRADPSRLYVLARVTSAVLGTLTVAAAGALGAAVGGRRVGLLAAGLCAVTFVLVREAHFGVDDTCVALLVTLGLLPCVRIARSGASFQVQGTRAGLRVYAAAGALAGLAFAAKYDGIALLVPLGVAHAFAIRNLARGRAFLWSGPGVALLACVVAALVAFPSLITEPGRVLNDVYVHLYLEARDGYDGLDPSGGYVFYARTLAIGLGWPLLLVTLAGLGLGVWRRDRTALVVAALPLAMLLVLGSQRLYFVRFALPAVPPLLVLAALALDGILARSLIAGAPAVLLVALPTAVDSVRFDALLGNQTDTRTLAREWLQSSLPAEARIAVEAPPRGPAVAGALASSDAAALYDVPLEVYRQAGAQYLVTSSYALDAPAVDPQRETKRQAFIAALGHLTPVAQFKPYAGDEAVPFAYDQIYGPFTSLDRLNRPGPTITVYRLTG